MEDYYWVHQYQDETMQAYAAWLDELAEDIRKILNEKNCAEKFWVSFYYTIKAKIDKQALQATTYHNLVAQAQHIKAHKRGYRSNNQQDN